MHNYNILHMCAIVDINIIIEYTEIQSVYFLKTHQCSFYIHTIIMMNNILILKRRSIVSMIKITALMLIASYFIALILVIFCKPEKIETTNEIINRYIFMCVLLTAAILCTIVFLSNTETISSEGVILWHFTG